MLLVGRKVAMNLANTQNVADGRRYADQFYEWKQKFGFPTTKDYTALYDAAITCASHRQDADEIIASLSIRERVRFGIHGLAKRVREIVNEREGGLRKPHKPRVSPIVAMKQRLDATEGELADARERLAADPGSLFDLKKDTPANIAGVIAGTVTFHKLTAIQKAIAEEIRRLKAEQKHAG
jgi:hypothetical protein